MTAPGLDAPTRNWGGVVVAVAGAFELAATLFNAIARAIPDFPTNLFGTISGLLLAAFVLVPIALVVGFAPLAFGTGKLAAIPGAGVRSRLIVFAAALVSAVVPFVLIFGIASSLGQDEEAVERVTSGSLVFEIFALLLGLVAGIVIARAGVARGYARWSLIITVLLIAVTIVLGYTNLAADWQDVPRAIGILALGISYWRVGLPSTHPLPE